MDEERRIRLARAATLVIGAFILSRALGLGREIIIGSEFGTTRELDAYLAAFRIPDLIFQLIAGGALGSAFIPTFTTYLARGREREAWRLASSIMNLVLVVLTACAVLAGLLAPWLVTTVVVPGFTADEQALTVQLMRIMLVSPVVFGLSGVIMGILNSRQHFLLPALAPAVYNLCIIGGAVLLAPTMGIHGLAVGVVAGSFMHLAIQIPQLVRQRMSYSPVIDVYHAGVREVGRLMLPRMLGLATMQINFMVNTFLASTLVEGSLAALNYAWLMMMLPQGIFAMGIATAAFPIFSELAATGRTDELRATLTETLRLILFVSIPSTVALIVLREPLTQLLLQRGRFDPSSTHAVAWALQFYALGLVAHSALEILTRGFYSMHDTRTPVAIGAGAMLLNIIFSLALIAPLQHGGLALANSLATILEIVVLLVVIRGRLGGFDGRALMRCAVKTGLAATVMGLAILWYTATSGASHVALRAGGGVLFGGVVFLIVSLATRSEELRGLRSILRRQRSHTRREDGST
ncbi:MAG TPA: murein biosynthesis integral membrane protein MurJ [Anaerolineae bacterium]|nr:murein biosynthesis integral membrane protein MurJ [Anaerolineae bacterium]